MKRTTIVLTDELAALIEAERRRRGSSAAAIVREALVGYFDDRPKVLAIAALGRSGHHHTARDAEAILAREWTPEHLAGGHAGGVPEVSPVDEVAMPIGAILHGGATSDKQVDGAADAAPHPGRRRGEGIDTDQTVLPEPHRRHGS